MFAFCFRFCDSPIWLWDSDVAFSPSFLVLRRLPAGEACRRSGRLSVNSGRATQCEGILPGLSGEPYVMQPGRLSLVFLKALIDTVGPWTRS